jgi:hypothetical protein
VVVEPVEENAVPLGETPATDHLATDDEGGPAVVGHGFQLSGNDDVLALGELVSINLYRVCCAEGGIGNDGFYSAYSRRRPLRPVPLSNVVVNTPFAYVGPKVRYAYRINIANHNGCRRGYPDLKHAVSGGGIENAAGLRHAGKEVHEIGIRRGRRVRLILHALAATRLDGRLIGVELFELGKHPRGLLFDLAAYIGHDAASLADQRRLVSLVHGAGVQAAR